jgi:hypothetical protein
MAKRVKKEEGREKAKKKRRTISPKFKPQIQMPPTSAALREYAKERKLHLLPARIKKGTNREETLAERASANIMNRRINVSMENTGRFYVSLCNVLYGGQITRASEAPLFPNDEKNVWSIHGFKPDILIKGDLKTTAIEVKATSSDKGRINFARKQYLRYSQAFLEDKGSEMFTSVFKYGRGKSMKLYLCENKTGHKCDNRCLVEKLSNSTRSLLVIPHNLLTFLLMISPSEEKYHSTSNTSRDYEQYKKVFGTYFTLLHDSWENPGQAIKNVLDFAGSKWLGLGDLNLDDFYLQDLQVTQQKAPDVYCRNRKIGQIVYHWKRGEGIVGQEWKPFIITEYKTPYNIEWRKYFEEKFDAFIKGLDMQGDYQDMLRWDMENAERQAIKDEARTELPKVKKDGIPI